MLNDSISRVIRKPESNQHSRTSWYNQLKSLRVYVAKWFIGLHAEYTPMSSISQRAAQPSKILEKFVWSGLLRPRGIVAPPLKSRSGITSVSSFDQLTRLCYESSDFTWRAIITSCNKIATGYPLNWEFILERERGSMGVVQRSCIEVNMTHEEDKIVRMCFKAAWYTCRRAEHMCVFETLRGRIGFSHRPVAPGQKLCVVPSGHYLHILTADKNGCVGFASVDGYMDDDLLEMLPSKDEMQELVAMGELFEMVTLH